MTPISTPRFSKQKTCSTPGCADSAAVRSAHASITVRIREVGNADSVALWSEVKQTTSQRPLPTRVSNNPPSAAVSPVPAKDGNRFSKTTTS